MRLAIRTLEAAIEFGYVEDGVFTSFCSQTNAYKIHVLGWDINSFPKATAIVVDEVETDEGYEQEEEETEVILIPPQLTKRLFITRDDNLALPWTLGLRDYTQPYGNQLINFIPEPEMARNAVHFYFDPIINIKIFYNWFGTNFIDNMRELYGHYSRADKRG